VSAAALRVAVTRDEPVDGPLTLALRQAGLEPVRCPVVRSAPAPEPERFALVARNLARYDWLVVASARAVSTLDAARGGEPLPRDLRAAAVGPRTARALTECGAVAPLFPRREGAGPLILLLREAGDWAGQRVLVPRALEGGRQISIALRGFGARVDEIIAYRTLACGTEDIRRDWRAAAADAVVVASPIAAEALTVALGGDALRRLDAVVAIGRTTASALGRAGVTALVPPRSDFHSVAEMLSRRSSSPGRKAPEAP
jgi:uroporphyrinogen-III synthase